MFAIVYAMVTLVASSMGISSFAFYGGLASALLLIQYLIGPKMVEWSMRIRYVSESEYPLLHRMVAEMAQRAGIPKPRIGIASIPIPNAFAFGRWKSDGRVCVTEQIMRLLSPDELKAVIGHEIAHCCDHHAQCNTYDNVVHRLEHHALRRTRPREHHNYRHLRLPDVFYHQPSGTLCFQDQGILC